MDTEREETSLREDISSAVESHAPEPSSGQDMTADLDVTPADTKPEADAKPTPRDRDPTGKFAKAATPSKSHVTPTPSKIGAATPSPLMRDAAAAPVAPPAPEIKAPQSWKAAEREAWAQIPPAAQAAINRREREAAAALQQSAPAREFQGQFQQMLSPYMGMIQAEGGHPLGVVQNLLQTSAALRTGAASTKAQIAASIIRDFGIPLELINAALEGQPMPQQEPQQAPQYRDPRVDQLFQHLSQAEHQRAQSLTQRASEDVETFASNAEFFDDVRHDVADMLESAARRGVELSIEDAYNRATRADPKLWEIIQQREKAKQANASIASTQRTRAAASSIRTQPAGTSAASEPGSIRESLMAAMGSNRSR